MLGQEDKKIRVLILGVLFFGWTTAEAAPKPNSEMRSVLRALEEKKGKSIESLTPTEARLQPTPTDATKSLLLKKNEKGEPEALAEVRDIQIDGAAGSIKARIYKPYNRVSLPVIVYFHGGGFVIASNDVYDASARALSKQAEAIVISPEYRKAPEHPFPAAHEDAFSAYLWVLKNVRELGGDPTRVAVAGESAGGNLALNVAIRARDTASTPPIHSLLIYPIAGNDFLNRSYRENAAAKPLNKPMMEWFLKHYLTRPEQKEDTRINLLGANLRGLKPVTVITAEIDPLRDEGKALSNRLKTAGVRVTYKNYYGVSHEFFGMGAVLSEARQAQRLAASDLKSAFNAVRPSE